MLRGNLEVGRGRGVQDVTRRVFTQIVLVVLNGNQPAGDQPLLVGRGVCASIGYEVERQALGRVRLGPAGMAEGARFLNDRVQVLGDGTDLLDGCVRSVVVGAPASGGANACRGLTTGHALPGRYRSGLGRVAGDTGEGTAGLSASQLPVREDGAVSG